MMDVLSKCYMYYPKSLNMNTFDVIYQKNKARKWSYKGNKIRVYHRNKTLKGIRQHCTVIESVFCILLNTYAILCAYKLNDMQV